MSKIFVDQVDPRTATTLTLGTTGDTVSIPTGVTIANAGTATGFGASLANGVDNRVVTATSATALNGEANLTFDGTLLNVGADTDAGYNPLQLGSTSDSHAYIQMLGSVSGQIHFGDATSGAAREIGALQYRHDTDSMFLKTNGTTAMTIDSAGIVTKPLQPAFLTVGASGAKPAIATQSNPFATVMTEIYDKNSDLSSSAIFTAPVTGTYVFYMHTKYDSADGDNFSHYFLASNRNSYFMNVKALDTVNAGSNTQWVSGSLSVDMDASDTMQIRTDWEATANRDRNTDPNWTYFSGYLLC